MVPGDTWQVAACRWLNGNQNIWLLGPVGVSKSITMLNMFLDWCGFQFPSWLLWLTLLFPLDLDPLWDVRHVSLTKFCCRIDSVQIAVPRMGWLPDDTTCFPTFGSMVAVVGTVLSVDTPKCWVFCGVCDTYQCSHASLMWRIWHTHTHTKPNFLKGIDEHTSMHECWTIKDFSTSPATSLWPIDQSRKERRH